MPTIQTKPPTEDIWMTIYMRRFLMPKTTARPTVKCMSAVLTAPSKMPMPKWLPYSGGSGCVARLSAITEYRALRQARSHRSRHLKSAKSTARKMWGDRYQVLVTVHLNTDNVHCHFVVNPVFIQGRCKVSKTKSATTRSFAVCRMRYAGSTVCLFLKTVTSTADTKRIIGGTKSGKKTHRDYLREDVEYCLSFATSPREFESQLICARIYA